MSTIDLLMITFNSADYVHLSLPRVLESCDEQTRVWIWHNGTDEETLEAARFYADDPRVHKFHHSVENVRLTEPTNWVWSNGDADFVSKVDDDCLLPVDWIDRLRQAHADTTSEHFGAIGSSRLRPEDIEPKFLNRKLATYGPVQLFRNNWVQGSGYLLPRRWVDKRGLLQSGESWTNYCLALAHDGAVHGYLYPLIFEDHMDDPRSEHTLLHSDEDLAWRMPLSAARNKVLTLDDWQARMKLSASEVQRAPVDLKHYRGWRLKLQHAQQKLAAKRRP